MHISHVGPELLRGAIDFIKSGTSVALSGVRSCATGAQEPENTVQVYYKLFSLLMSMKVRKCAFRGPIRADEKYCNERK